MDFLPIEKKLKDGLITKQIFTRDFKPKITNKKKDPNKSLRLYHKFISTKIENFPSLCKTANSNFSAIYYLLLIPLFDRLVIYREVSNTCGTVNLSTTPFSTFAPWNPNVHKTISMVKAKIYVLVGNGKVNEFQWQIASPYATHCLKLSGKSSRIFVCTDISVPIGSFPCQRKINPVNFQVKSNQMTMQSRIWKILTFLLLDPPSLLAGVDCFASLMIFSDDDVSAVEYLVSADDLPNKCNVSWRNHDSKYCSSFHDGYLKSYDNIHLLT